MFKRMWHDIHARYSRLIGMTPYPGTEVVNTYAKNIPDQILEGYTLLTLAQASDTSLGFDQLYLKDIVKHQNNDGGFGLFPNSPSDMIGVYFAVYILAYFNQLALINISTLKELILDRALSTGGFANIVSQEDDYEVTYYIYRYPDIFGVQQQKIQPDLPDPALSRYNTYYYMLLMQVLSLPVADIAIPEPQDNLRDIYYYVLQMEVSGTPLSPEKAQWVAEYMTENYPSATIFDNESEANIDSIAMAFTIYSVIDKQQVTDLMLQRFDDLISTRLKAEILDLYDLHSALFSMQRYGYNTTSQPALIKWILDCFAPTGGTKIHPSLESSNIPSLFFTGIALDSLSMLGQDVSGTKIEELLQKRP